MKLTYFQIEHQIEKKLAPIYILSGEEILLKQDIGQWIRRAAKLSGYTERVRIIPEAGFNWEQLYSHLNSNSLLAEKRLIEIDLSSVKPPKAATEILKSYCNNPSPDNVVVLDVGKADSKMTRTKWFQAIEKAGILVNIWPIPRDKLPQWLVGRSKKYKLNLSLSAANTLAELVEGNLIAAQQALEKLYLLRSKEAISSELITSLLTNESHFSVFELVESLLSKNKKRVFDMLSALKTEGIEPILVLWAITREVRIMATITDEIANGAHLESLFSKHRIFSRRQGLVRQFLNSTPTSALNGFLTSAAHIDQSIKGIAQGNPWNELQILCLKIINSSNQAVRSQRLSNLAS